VTLSQRIRQENGFDFETAGEEEFERHIHALEDAADSLHGALGEALGLIPLLAEQQAMDDDWWKEGWERWKQLL
jgi:hypothetical protein